MSTGAVSVKNAAYFQAILPGAAQKIAFNGSSKQSTAMESETTLVRLFSTQDCYIAVGANPTAEAEAEGSTKPGTLFLAGGIYEYIGIAPGQKIAVIQDSTSGTLHITEAK